MLFENVPEEIITAELPKVPTREDGTAVWEWMDFLCSKREEEFEMAAERNSDIREAVDTLYRLSGNREVRAQYEARMKAWRDWKTDMEGFFEDGIRKNQLDTARRMKAEGFSPEIIARISGLDPEILETL